jgi:HAD superfamily hydrolase (TIGR01509 family)
LNVRAIVFDFDGVIANSEPLHFRAYREVLAERGVLLSESEYYSRYLGYDDVGAFLAVAGDRGVSWGMDVVDDLVRRKSVCLARLEQEASVLFPGAADAIRRLAARVPLAIASGALRAEIARTLEREGLAQHFNCVVAAGDTAVSKPAPDPYRQAVKLLGKVPAVSASGALAASECVAIEDSHWGLQSARAAGLVTIGLTNTYPSESLAAADAVLDHLDRLTWDFLERLPTIPRGSIGRK